MTQCHPVNISAVATDEARAIDAVRARLRELGWTQAKLQDEAPAAEATIRDFLTGKRWPRDQTLDRIDGALGWPLGSIAGIAEGAPIPRTEDLRPAYSATGPGIHSVGRDLDSIVVVMPDGWRDGLSDLEAAEIEAKVKLEALRLARELRADRTRREEPAQQ